MRIPCIKCGTEILEATAKVNNGLCGPCAKGGGFCVVCGGRVWEANKSGEYIHVDCNMKRRNQAAALRSGIHWNESNDIDWEVLGEGVSNAIANCFSRVATANPQRLITEVVVAYRLGEGIRIEPCVTFSDGEYFNASTEDDALYRDLEPFDSAITRIGEALDSEQEDQFFKLLDEKFSELMKGVFERLKRSDFGLKVKEGYSAVLKEF